MTIDFYSKEYPYISFENSSAGPEDKSFGNLIEIVEEPTDDAVKPMRMVILNCDNKRMGVDLFTHSELATYPPLWVVEQGSVRIRKMTDDEKALFQNTVVSSLTQEQFALVKSILDEMQ